MPHYGVTVRLAVWIVPAKLAVKVTLVEDATLKCLTVNLAELWPANIVTMSGTLSAEVSELISVILSPPVGAGPDSATVPVTLVVELPLTEEGETDRLVSTAARTVNVACSWLEP